MGALSGVGTVMRHIADASGHIGQCPCPLDMGTHGQQHALDIGVVDDRHRAVRARQVTALHAVARKAHGLLVGAVGHRNALHAHGKTGRIHHDEHVLQAAVLLAHQVAHRTTVVAKLQHGRGAGLDAELVFNGDTPGIIARAQAAIIVHHEFGNHKQADALHPIRCTRHPGKNQVHDVLRHVVLAIGDENLGAKHLVVAVTLRLGSRTHGGQVGTGLWLGQVHGAGPFAADELGGELALQFVAAGHQQRFNGAVGQHGAQGKREAGGVQHFGAGCGHQLGEALSAESDGVDHALPAAFGKLGKSLFEAGSGGDHTVFPTARVLVTFPVQRGHHTLTKLGRLLQHRLGRVQAIVFHSGQRGDIGKAGQLLHGKQHVFEGGLVTHGVLSKVGVKGVRLQPGQTLRPLWQRAAPTSPP